MSRKTIYGRDLCTIFVSYKRGFISTLAHFYLCYTFLPSKADGAGGRAWRKRPFEEVGEGRVVSSDGDKTAREITVASDDHQEGS